MWSGQNKIWIYKEKDIIASDVRTAKFLAAYQRFSKLNNTYLPFIEIIDLNKHKVISRKDKIKKILDKREEVPFVFVVGKN